MAKKVRKPRAADPRTYAQTPTATTPVAPAAASATTKASASKVSNGTQVVASAKSVDLAAEYATVGGDLRRLLITAGVMFAVLITANVVINLLR